MTSMFSAAHRSHAVGASALFLRPFISTGVRSNPLNCGVSLYSTLHALPYFVSTMSPSNTRLPFLSITPASCPTVSLMTAYLPLMANHPPLLRASVTIHALCGAFLYQLARHST